MAASTNPNGEVLHARMEPSAVLDKPHNLASSPPPPGSPMPPAASLTAQSEGTSNRSTSTAAPTSDSSAAPHASQPAPPPEVEATLSKLTAHRNVTGCLILSRPEALVIRAGGKDFDPSGPGAHDRSERLRRVVKLVRQAVDVLGTGVQNMDESDDLGFVRVRTGKYEMMISPSDKYILVVFQDPALSP